MNIILKILTKFKYRDLIIMSLALGLAPFVRKPHLLEKLQYLFEGNLSKAADIFDLFMHGTPLILLVLKYFFRKKIKRLLENQ